jgi:hypothetical protein
LEVYPNTSGVFIGVASNHVHIITHIHPTEAPAFFFSYKEELIALLKDNSVDYNEDFLLK